MKPGEDIPCEECGEFELTILDTPQNSGGNIRAFDFICESCDTPQKRFIKLDDKNNLVKEDGGFKYVDDPYE